MQPKKLVLIVIDGLTPAMLEDAVERTDVPALRFLEGARRVPAGGHDLPLADAGLSLVSRHRSSPRRARHPAPRLVPPRGRAARGVRLVLRRNPRGGNDSLDPRRGLQHERGAPLARRGDCLRVARGRRPRDGGGEHGLLPREDPTRADGAGARPPCLRPSPVLLLQPLRVGRDRLAPRDPHPRPRLGRRVRGCRRTLARDAGRLRLSRLLPAGLRLRVTRGRAGDRPRSAEPGRQRDRLAARGSRRAGRVPRALRGPPLLGPRPDSSRQLGSPGGRLLRIQALPPRERAWRRARGHRLEPCGHGLPPSALHRRGEGARRAFARERARRSLPRGRHGRRPAGRGGAALRSG